MIIVGEQGCTLADIRPAFYGPVRVQLADGYRDRLRDGRAVLEAAIARQDVIYAVNTGFGKLSDRSIAPDDVIELQRRLIRSHSVGVGPLIDDRVVRGVLLLKVMSLAQGYSGVRPEVVHTLAAMLEHDILPCIPSFGSVGASGDLAPLAHLTAAALGQADVRVNGVQQPAAAAMAAAGMQPLTLRAKEAIALINGTQVSTALTLAALFDGERAFRAAVGAGALSLEALAGNIGPFDDRIHQLRRQRGQIDVAAAFRTLLVDSPLLESDRPRRTQDMYSLRCQPQVLGAALDLIRYAADVLEREANSVTDNPLIFAADDAILSGGNFHAEPVAFAADALVMALCEIGSISERRQFVLNDASLSGLPAFLTANPGLNSGMTMTQVTSAALVAENRGHAFPRSVDNVPTVANQEDHVSMATGAGRRAIDVAANTTHIIATELLMAAQALDMQTPPTPGPGTAPIRDLVRTEAAFLADDRPLSGEMQALARLVHTGAFADLIDIETF